MSAAVQRVDPAAEEDRVIARALEILTRHHARGKPLTDPEATRAYLRLRLAERPCEIFGGTALLLGSWYGLLGGLLLIGMVAWRAVQEERVLRDELEGYSAYMTRVRYRFVPFLW